MKLTKIANKAAKEASQALGEKLTPEELDKVAAVIARAMEKAVHEASELHASACMEYLSQETDLAHKLQREIERKKIALMANLSSLR